MSFGSDGVVQAKFLQCRSQGQGDRLRIDVPLGACWDGRHAVVGPPFLSKANPRTSLRPLIVVLSFASGVEGSELLGI